MDRPEPIWPPDEIIGEADPDELADRDIGEGASEQPDERAHPQPDPAEAVRPDWGASVWPGQAAGVQPDYTGSLRPDQASGVRPDRAAGEQWTAAGGERPGTSGELPGASGERPGTVGQWTGAGGQWTGQPWAGDGGGRRVPANRSPWSQPPRKTAAATANKDSTQPSAEERADAWGSAWQPARENEAAHAAPSAAAPQRNNDTSPHRSPARHTTAAPPHEPQLTWPAAPDERPTGQPPQHEPRTGPPLLHEPPTWPPPKAAGEPPWPSRSASESLSAENGRDPGRVQAPTRHIAVAGGTERAGRLVAKQLAEALDEQRVIGTAVSDAGPTIGSPAWTSALDLADEIVLAVDAVGTGPVEAKRLLDRLAPDDFRQAVTVVLLPPPRRGLSRGHEDIGAIREHFGKRTRAVLFVPNDPNPTPTTTAAWERVLEAL